MSGNRAIIFGAAVCLALAATAGAQERPSAFAPADAGIVAIAVAGEPAHYGRPGSDGASELTTTIACSDTRPRRSDVELAWSVDGTGVAQVRVDITEFGRGFANGEFLTTGPLPTGARDAFFADAEPGIYYYWRLLTLEGGTWSVAANGRFEAPVCPFDEVAE